VKDTCRHLFDIINSLSFLVSDGPCVEGNGHVLLPSYPAQGSALDFLNECLGVPGIDQQRRFIPAFYQNPPLSTKQKPDQEATSNDPRTCEHSSTQKPHATNCGNAFDFREENLFDALLRDDLKSIRVN
jgi:hypothetical protein